MYTKTKISEKTIGKGKNKLKETVVKVSRDDKKMIDPEDITELVEELETKVTKAHGKHKLRVRALNVDKWYTLKGYDDDVVNVESVEEYLDGRVKDSTKFGKFYQIELTVIRNA